MGTNASQAMPPTPTAFSHGRSAGTATRLPPPPPTASPRSGWGEAAGRRWWPRGARTLTGRPPTVPPGRRFLPLHTVSLGRGSAAPGADALDLPGLEAPAAGRRAGPPGARAPAHVASPRRAVPPQRGSEREKGKDKGKKQRVETGEVGSRSRLGQASLCPRAPSREAFRIRAARARCVIGRGQGGWRTRDQDREAKHTCPLASHTESGHASPRTGCRERLGPVSSGKEGRNGSHSATSDVLTTHRRLCLSKHVAEGRVGVSRVWERAGRLRDGTQSWPHGES